MVPTREWLDHGTRYITHLVTRQGICPFESSRFYIVANARTHINTFPPPLTRKKSVSFASTPENLEELQSQLYQQPPKKTQPYIHKHSQFLVDLLAKELNESKVTKEIKSEVKPLRKHRSYSVGTQKESVVTAFERHLFRLKKQLSRRISASPPTQRRKISPAPQSTKTLRYNSKMDISTYDNVDENDNSVRYKVDLDTGSVSTTTATSATGSPVREHFVGLHCAPA
jgi:hypothetical protein